MGGSDRYVFLNAHGQWYYFDSLSQPLGMGAMGIVYLGYNYYTRQPVAVKMVRPEFYRIPEVRDRARLEAEMTFLHPNIVRMLGLCEPFQDNGPMYILSEYVDGLNFDEYCNNFLSPLKNSDRVLNIVQCVIPILDALQYVHKIGLIHRDVKPSNIRIARDGTPKLMDLGISKFGVGTNTTEQGFAGTALYAAPELFSGGDIDFSVDIYALGVTMFELIAGYNPFNGATLEDIVRCQKTEKMPWNDKIPQELMTILNKATEKKKSKRYGSSADFSMALSLFVKHYVSNPEQIQSEWLFGHKDRW